MAATAVSFNRVFNKIQTQIPICIKQENVYMLKEIFDIKISEGIKCCVEAAVRDYVIRKLSTKNDLRDIQLVVKMCIEGARQELCLPTLPVFVLSDALDCLTLTKCEEMFEFVESNVSVFKEELFFSPCKNQVLRMCNDVLRRLSRSQNTIFCGRILLFLARFFPFSERSGLNLISEFNLENVTIFTDSATSDMDVTEGEDSVEDENVKNPSRNYTLYTKFWSLQDFFRNPSQCFQKASWNMFTKYAEDIFEAFSSFKLESVQEKKGHTHKAPKIQSEKPSTDPNEQYFPKYLTNQKLLDLQFSDSNFRRYILLQMLILAHYLISNVKFKQETLTTEQAEWVSKMGERAVILLADTPTNGIFFVDLVKHIFRRESKWSEWKNNGCPEIKKPGTSMKLLKRPLDTKEEADTDAKPPLKKIRRRVGDLIHDADARKKYTMGNAEMSRLWNICPSNLDSCQQRTRDFAPNLETYFGTAIDQVLGKAETKTPEERLVNDGNFAWRGLRLLANKSPHFFTHSANAIAALPDYLTTMVKKLAKDLPSHNEEKQEDEEEEKEIELEQADKVEEEEDDNDNQDEQTQEEQVVPLKDEEIKVLAANLSQEGQDAWNKLAKKIGFEPDELEYFKEEKKSLVDGIILMFERWIENDKEEANKENLIYILEGLKLKSVYEGAFPQQS